MSKRVLTKEEAEWQAERQRIERWAIDAIRAGVRMKDIAAQADYSVATLRIWATRAGLPLRYPQTGPTYIYCLKSPLDGLIYYVGKSNNPSARLRAHLKTPTNSYMADWVASLRRAGCKPKLVVLACLRHEASKWRSIELQFMAKYQRLGHPLLNIEIAGWSGVPVREHVKEEARRNEKESGACAGEALA